MTRRTRAAAAAAATAAAFADAFPTPVTTEHQSNTVNDTQEETMQEAAVPITRRTRAAAAAAAAATAVAAAHTPVTTGNQSNIADDAQEHTTQEAAGLGESEEVSVSTENIQDFTGTVRLVEDRHIVSNTQMTYNCTLTDFMIYLFTNSIYFLSVFSDVFIYFYTLSNI